MQMATERGEWGRLREEPARWPDRGRERDEPHRQRWLREPEPYEDRALFEPYPGATVLEDLAVPAEDGVPLRVLARYTVIRILLLGMAGTMAGAALRTERRIAMRHLALLPKHDWERLTLERLTAECCDNPEPGIMATVIIAAECAAKRGQPMGAYALYRGAFELGRRNGWWDEAARCAAGIERLARLDEAHVSARVWGWRCRVLEGRGQRDRERTADGTPDGAGTGQPGDRTS
jgi:hypothetical protein